MEGKERPNRVLTIVGNDLDAIMLPDSDARVGRAKIDSDSLRGTHGVLRRSRGVVMVDPSELRELAKTHIWGVQRMFQNLGH